mmetsp:Transcript_7027/g.16235  ORF Transcript_7027/g.16235 Transcript_7027/m.16235 type:complete len:351 (-) Transcript_7027:92-1144(-)
MTGRLLWRLTGDVVPGSNLACRWGGGGGGAAAVSAAATICFSRSACEVFSRAFLSPTSFQHLVCSSCLRNLPGGSSARHSLMISMATRGLSRRLEAMYRALRPSTICRYRLLPGWWFVPPPRPKRQSFSPGSRMPCSGHAALRSARRASSAADGGADARALGCSRRTPTITGAWTLRGTGCDATGIGSAESPPVPAAVSAHRGEPSRGTASAILVSPQSLPSDSGWRFSPSRLPRLRLALAARLRVTRLPASESDSTRSGGLSLSRLSRCRFFGGPPWLLTNLGDVRKRAPATLLLCCCWSLVSLWSRSRDADGCDINGWSVAHESVNGGHGRWWPGEVRLRGGRPSRLS